MNDKHKEAATAAATSTVTIKLLFGENYTNFVVINTRSDFKILHYCHVPYVIYRNIYNVLIMVH
jgi:hypothetical protein